MPHLDLEDSFGFLVNRLARAVESSFDGALARHGLSASGWGILKTLELSGPSTLTEITRALGIDASNTGRQVERLASRDLVIVRRDSHDARARRVALAPAGHALLPDLEKLARDYNARWLSPLPENDRKVLLESLRSMLVVAGVLTSKGERNVQD